MSIRHLVRNALRPGYLPVLADKLMVRAVERYRRGQPGEAQRWCASRAESQRVWAEARAPALWREAEAVGERIRTHGSVALEAHGLPMGGGGDYRLLYFLTRRRRPEVVVETGVAAGFSSHAFLAALAANEHGRLFSSDFPYFRLPEPERLVGCAVPYELRDRWVLYLDGDRKNLRRILERVPSVDLFHYDSDKSYLGRERALAMVAPRLRTGATVLFDDIQDNLFFKDLVGRTDRRHHVFEFEGKFLGLVEW